MAFHKASITDGEIDALYRAARAAASEDTRYPAWGRVAHVDDGHCYCFAHWLTERLGGHIGAHRGHYAWLSPDERYYIDLTGEHSGAWRYEPNQKFHRVSAVANDRTSRFSKRADRCFDSLDQLLRLGFDQGDAYPAEQPQASDDSDRFADSWTDPDTYWHDEPDPTTPAGEYAFVWANGQLEVSPTHSHAELAGHAGIDPASHRGPFASGHVVVTNGQAIWQVQANVNLHAFLKILKDASKQYGWRWGGMTDASGQPIIDDFGPSKTSTTLHYVYANHLLLGRTSSADLSLRFSDAATDAGVRPLMGTITTIGARAIVDPVHLAALPSLFDWADDSGLTLYAANDNVIKTIPDLQQHDNYNPQTAESPNPVEPPPVDERLPSGLYSCPSCAQLFPNWHEYSKHRRQDACAVDTDHPDANGDGGLPQPDPGLYGDGAHFTEMRQEPGITTGSVKTTALFHVAPTTERARIQQHGLQPSDPKHNWQRFDNAPPEDLPPTGVYMFNNRDRADAYRTMLEFRRGVPHDVWAVDNPGDAEPDPDLGSSAKYVTRPVQPRLVEGPEHREDMPEYMRPQYLQPTDPWQRGDWPLAPEEGQGRRYPSNDPAAWQERVGHIRILPARTWKEAARVDGFHGPEDAQYYVAYRNGNPLAYAALHGNAVAHVHSVESSAEVVLWQRLARYYDTLTASTKPATRGWLQVTAAKWKWAKGTEPKDMIEAALPFIYDVDKDKIYIGHPGARTSDIPGRFTPGGIVEGQYEPGGKVVLRSLTSTPYTVRHMIELWYYTQPSLEVKSVHLQDDAGKSTKLASPIELAQQGQRIRTLAAIHAPTFLASQALANAGAEVYVVGGAVRDTLLGKEVSDIDLMVTGLPEKQVESTLRKLRGSVAHEGKDFKVFHYRYHGDVVHVALPRAERSTGEGHKDFEVTADHAMTPEQDFARRDYTCNAMGVSLKTGKLIDPYGGACDIERGILRATGPTTLAEDPLRVLRGIVAYARHGLVPDEATRAQMTANAGSLEHLPSERIREELDKLLGSAEPAAGIRLAHETGALAYVLPEVEQCMGFDQNNPHHELDLGEHLLKVLERISRCTDDPDLRMAALLHDIGKPGSAWTDPDTGRNHYYAKHVDGSALGADHETLGAELAHRRLIALRYPNERIARIEALVRWHMFAGFTTLTGARRFLARVGDHAEDLFLLRWADQGGKDVQPHQEADPAWNVARNRRLVSKVIEAGEAFDRSGLAIDGHDLIGLGLQGRQIGDALSRLAEHVIEDPSLNERDTLLRLAAA